MELYNQILYFLLGILWHDALVYLLVCAGIYFTIRTKFVQFRSLPEMIRLLRDSNETEKGISSLQAFLVSLSVRVGTGNVAGTATAILFGGPGAVFWMWIIAIVGAATAYVESTLAQVYKSEVAGQFVGGPGFYAEKAFSNKSVGKVYGSILSVMLMISTVIGYPGIQSNIIASSFETAFGINNLVTGVLVVGVLGWIIFGGIKRIARASEKIVPAMCVLYIIIALVVIVMNITAIPEVFALIINSAFNTSSALGGMIGSAITWGVRRGVYSNEAGLGSGTSAAAAADTSHPAKQGLIQSCSVYVDTLLICSATAFIILLTNSYNVLGPEGMIIENLPGVEDGTAFVLNSVNMYIPFGNAIMTVILTAFAFTCMYGGYFQAEASAKFFLRNRSDETVKKVLVVLKTALLIMAFMGTQFTAQTAWNTVDVFGGAMAWMHMLLIISLSGITFKVLNDYESQKKEGKEPTFDPTALGIKGTDVWIKSK